MDLLSHLQSLDALPAEKGLPVFKTHKQENSNYSIRTRGRNIVTEGAI